MSGGIKELKLWQEAVALGASAVRLGRAGTKRETRVITDRLMLAASDVAVRIAQGYVQDAAPRQLEHYVRAREALAELETLLTVARQAGLFGVDAVAPVSARATTVHRLLSGYVAYVDRQVSESSDPPAGPPGQVANAGTPALPPVTAVRTA